MSSNISKLFETQAAGLSALGDMLTDTQAQSMKDNVVHLQVSRFRATLSGFAEKLLQCEGKEALDIAIHLVEQCRYNGQVSEVIVEKDREKDSNAMKGKEVVKTDKIGGEERNMIEGKEGREALESRKQEDESKENKKEEQPDQLLFGEDKIPFHDHVRILASLLGNRANAGKKEAEYDLEMAFYIYSTNISYAKYRRLQDTGLSFTQFLKKDLSLYRHTISSIYHITKKVRIHFLYLNEEPGKKLEQSMKFIISYLEEALKDDKNKEERLLSLNYLQNRIRRAREIAISKSRSSGGILVEESHLLVAIHFMLDHILQGYFDSVNGFHKYAKSRELHESMHLDLNDHLLLHKLLEKCGTLSSNTDRPSTDIPH